MEPLNQIRVNSNTVQGPREAAHPRPLPGSLLESAQTSQEQTWEFRDFPGSPVVNGLCFHCRGWSSRPDQGTKTPHSQKKKTKNT